MFGVSPTDWRRPFPRTGGPAGLPPPSSGPPSRLARVLGVGLDRAGGVGRPPGPAGWLVPRTIVGLAVWSLLLATILGVVVALGFAASQARISQKEQAALGRSRTPGEAAPPGPSPSPGPSPKDPLTELVASAGRSVVVVEDFDPSGATTAGSGFVLQATPSDIWVVTSYSLVRAAKTADRTVKVRLPNFQRLDGSIRSSDPDRDLALVDVEGENLPSLNRFAPPVTQTGAPVYVLEATAGTGKVAGHLATVSQVTGDGLLLQSTELAAGVGGPVLDADGNVVGVLPVRYVPKGQTTPGIWAVPAQLMCRRLIVCPASALNVQPSVTPSASPG
jgi:S1-C subfamily serine protease